LAHSEGFVPLQYEAVVTEQAFAQLRSFGATLRRPAGTSTDWSQPVSEGVIRLATAVAGRSPSGANQQPWRYVVLRSDGLRQRLHQAVAQDLETARRSLPPKVERALVSDRSADVALLETAPVVVALVRQSYGLRPSGERQKHYYALESTAISGGFFFTALRHAGLDCALIAPPHDAARIMGLPPNESVQTFFCIGRASPPPHDVEDEASLLESLYRRMKSRRVIRDFSTRPVDPELIASALDLCREVPKAAGVHPWRFLIVDDPQRQGRIREAAEHEEKLLYEQRISDEWREALAPLGTVWRKPYLTDVSHLVAWFKLLGHDDERRTVFDSSFACKGGLRAELSGMAAGLAIMALHHAGLFTLTHTPNPMTFMRDILQRPTYEMPFLLMPIGYPAEGCLVPNIGKKPLDEIYAVI
jgi:nitroreductase